MVAAARPAREHADDQLEPVYVWDLVVRITHWAVALSMVVLTVTGLYIGQPFVSAPGPASEHSVMGWARALHFYAALVFSLAVGARIVWMFTGPRQSGWRQFIPTSRRRWRDLFGTIKFYLLVRSTPPATIGHNPLAGASYLAVFGLYLVMIATGFALYSIGAQSYMKMWDFLLPVFGGAQWARWLHHVVMWVLLLFVVFHVNSAILTSRVEKNGTLDSIFSGFKFLPKRRKGDDDD